MVNKPTVYTLFPPDNVPKQELLPFISNAKLFTQVKRVIDLAKGTLIKKEKQFYKNSVDPFSAVFDAMWQGITLEEWLKQEKSRQNQKTLQNALGDFHQGILGSFDGWEDMGRGKVFDLKNSKLKVIAEVKNKFNTTKGNHKVVIYDDLNAQLQNEFKDYTAYYVEVIPQSKKTYNNPFVPSDNKSHKQRSVNDKIRRIDGKSFYELATQDPNALKKLYEALPTVIANILGKEKLNIKATTAFQVLFERIY